MTPPARADAHRAVRPAPVGGVPGRTRRRGARPRERGGRVDGRGPRRRAWMRSGPRVVVFVRGVRGSTGSGCTMRESSRCRRGVSRARPLISVGAWAGTLADDDRRARRQEPGDTVATAASLARRLAALKSARASSRSSLFSPTPRKLSVPPGSPPHLPRRGGPDCSQQRSRIQTTGPDQHF